MAVNMLSRSALRMLCVRQCCVRRAAMRRASNAAIVPNPDCLMSLGKVAGSKAAPNMSLAASDALMMLCAPLRRPWAAAEHKRRSRPPTRVASKRPQMQAESGVLGAHTLLPNVPAADS